MLPWFAAGNFPIFLAPMAGVTDVVFRRICKEMGADVMVTEFVSAEGILQRDDRTRRYTEFTDEQRPVGVQLFGADGIRMGEAALKIIDWKQPDFIDINFGCPVNKVVARNGGSSLLRDCPLLASVARGVVEAVGGRVPVTAKIRIGWDQQSINAVEVADTTGAGDAFTAAVLAALIRSPRLLEDAPALEAALRYANAFAALTTTRRGAIPAMPDPASVDRFLATH